MKNIIASLILTIENLESICQKCSGDIITESNVRYSLEILLDEANITIGNVKHVIEKLQKKKK
ncbi:MAG: hypothetical protein AABY32_07385 [Nanoarchaeota archaeon]